jgi:hypothetical protein
MSRPVRNRKRPKHLESQAKIIESEEEVDSSADPALSADRDLEYNPPPATLSKSRIKQDRFPFIYKASLERRRRAIVTDSTPPLVLAGEGYVPSPRKYKRSKESPRQAALRERLERDFRGTVHEIRGRSSDDSGEDLHAANPRIVRRIREYLVEIEELFKHYEELTDIPCFLVSRSMKQEVMDTEPEYEFWGVDDDALFQDWILEHNTAWVSALLRYLHTLPTSLLSRLPLEIVDMLPPLVARSYNKWPCVFHCLKYSSPECVIASCDNGGDDGTLELKTWITRAMYYRRMVWEKILKVKAVLPSQD